MKRLIYFLMALLGFGSAGCSNADNITETPVMYGTPTAKYKFNVRVVDPEGKPVNGIDVTISQDPDFKIDWERVLETTTNENGALKDDTTPKVSPVDRLTMRLIDPDGEDNGGDFCDKCVDIDLSNIKKIEEGGSWYTGCYEVNVGEVKLKHRDASSEDEPIVD